MEWPVLHCPSCGYSLPPGVSSCPDCKEDLAAWLKLKLAPHIEYKQGLRLARQGDLERALLKLLQATNALPSEPEPALAVAQVYMQKGEWVQARRWWEHVLQRWPEQEEARQSLAALDARALEEKLRARREKTRLRLGRTVMGLVYFGLGALVVVVIFIQPGLFPRPTGRLALSEQSPAPSQVIPTGQAVVSTTFVTSTPTHTGNAHSTPEVKETLLTPAPTLQPEASPAPTQLPTATPTPDLVGAVLAAMRADPELSELSFQVRQQGSAIWLEGEVPGVWAKYRVEGLAGEVPGVESVDVTGLRVVYRVRSGDTLSEIALGMYERVEFWPFIAAANELTNPNRIYPGQTLVIPPPN